jgi:hypothetical protein
MNVELKIRNNSFNILLKNTRSLFEARVREILLSGFQKFKSELKLTQENNLILSNSFSQTWI